MALAFVNIAMFGIYIAREVPALADDIKILATNVVLSLVYDYLDYIICAHPKISYRHTLVRLYLFHLYLSSGLMCLTGEGHGVDR